MKKFAITGGIASGKTTLLNELQRRGFPVFNCDTTIANLYKEHEILQALQKIIPFCFNDGIFNKKALLGELIKKPSLFKKLENVLYPHLYKKMETFERSAKIKGHKVAFIEVPLLFEKHKAKLYDGVIVINSNRWKRKRNFINRGGNVEVFNALNAMQWSDARKISIAKKYGFVLFSLTSPKMLPKEVNILLRKIKE